MPADNSQCYYNNLDIRRVIVDREAMAARFLASLARDGRDGVTVMRGNQYEGLQSFTDVGEFIPLSWDKQGGLTREVASARCSLPLPGHPAECLDLRVTLVRDLRCRVPGASESDKGSQYEPHVDDPFWFDDGWVATAVTEVRTEPALVPIVTTADESDAEELARVYTHRWSAEENVIRDWLLPLGLDTNHGYEKKLVPNSEAEKKRAALEKRLVNIRRWAEKARLASLRAQKTSDRRWKKTKASSREAYSELNEKLFALEPQGLSEREYRMRKKELTAAVEAEMEGHWRGYYRAHDTCNREYAKWERYCREQGEILRELENLKAGERQMYELDDSKDQVMTALKLALANLAMWVRDRYFPPEYANSTWKRLVPFFRLAGRIVQGPDAVCVELRAFNDRGLSRDLDQVCGLVSNARHRLLGGRRLTLAVEGAQGTARTRLGRRAA